MIHSCSKPVGWLGMSVVNKKMNEWLKNKIYSQLIKLKANATCQKVGTFTFFVPMLYLSLFKC